mgnify:FL=1
MTQTKFAKLKNPWTGEKPAPRKITMIDPDDLEICDDPLPQGRAMPEGKYSAKFAALAYGQCLKCPPGAAPKIATALKKWLDVNKKPGSVRSAIRYSDDGTGRVWLLAPVPKALKRAA